MSQSSNIDPGELRYRLEIFKLPQDAQDPWNVVENKQLLATVWAAMRFAQASETELAEQLVNRQSAEFVVRYKPDLFAELNGRIQLKCCGQLFDLLTYHDPNQRRQWLHLKAQTRPDPHADDV